MRLDGALSPITLNAICDITTCRKQCINAERQFDFFIWIDFPVHIDIIPIKHRFNQFVVKRVTCIKF